MLLQIERDHLRDRQAWLIWPLHHLVLPSFKEIIRLNRHRGHSYIIVFLVLQMTLEISLRSLKRPWCCSDLPHTVKHGWSCWKNRSWSSGCLEYQLRMMSSVSYTPPLYSHHYYDNPTNHDYIAIGAFLSTMISDLLALVVVIKLLLSLSCVLSTISIPVRNCCH